LRTNERINLLYREEGQRLVSATKNNIRAKKFILDWLKANYPEAEVSLPDTKFLDIVVFDSDGTATAVEVLVGNYFSTDDIDNTVKKWLYVSRHQIKTDKLKIFIVTNNRDNS